MKEIIFDCNEIKSYNNDDVAFKKKKPKNS